MPTETASSPVSAPLGVETLAPAVIAADRSGSCTGLNPAARALLGGGADRRSGRALLRAVPAPDRAAVLGAWRELRAGVGRVRAEFRLRRPDGSSTWYLAEVQAIVGDEPAFAGVVTDIGALKRRETGLQAALAATTEEMKGRSDFLAALSHDLRSPLNAVIGLTESLVETGAPFDPVRTDKYLKLVNASGRQLLGQLNEVIDLARLDAGRTVPSRSAVDVGSAVRTLGEAARKEGAAKGVEVATDRPATPLVIATDERLLWQVLQILLHNAVKFTPSAGRVTLTAAAAAAGAVRIEVRDTGAGMPPEKAARLFAPHVPGGGGRRTGPGVGLTLVGRIVPLLGGRITVASAPGAGTVFTLELPPA
jgi:PAS domain S-box-containing protein